MHNDYDISNLGLTAEPETIEPEAYTPPYNEKATGAVDRATYTVKFIGGGFRGESQDEKRDLVFSASTSKRNGKSYLAARFCVEVQDAMVHGKPVGTRRVYGRVDTIPESLKFQNVKEGRENANAFMDALRASGWTEPLRTNDDYKNAILTLIEQGSQTRALVIRSAWSNPKSTEYAGSGLSLRTEEELAAYAVPGDPDRVFSPGQYDGEPPKLLIQNEIKAFYPLKK